LSRTFIFSHVVPGVLLRRFAQHRDRPGIGTDDVHDHPDGRRLARSVGSEQSEDPPGGNIERDAVDGPEAVEFLDHIAQGDGGVHG
jgi:hypothetical protein